MLSSVDLLWAMFCSGRSGVCACEYGHIDDESMYTSGLTLRHLLVLQLLTAARSHSDDHRGWGHARTCVRWPPLGRERSARVEAAIESCLKFAAPSTRSRHGVMMARNLRYVIERVHVAIRVDPQRSQLLVREAIRLLSGYYEIEDCACSNIADVSIMRGSCMRPGSVDGRYGLPTSAPPSSLAVSLIDVN